MSSKRIVSPWVTTSNASSGLGIWLAGKNMSFGFNALRKRESQKVAARS